MPGAVDAQLKPINDRTALRQTNISARPAASSMFFLFLVACACVWVLHLPVFPSQDGPAHVYYARIARDLLFGGHAYAGYFRIARPFPPYSIHAYVLMALLPFSSSETAEKLLVCLSMLVCGGGLLYLSRQLGRTQIVCALAVPFLLNRYLFLGFYGYIIATGFAMAAMGMWLSRDRGKPARRAIFILLTLLTLFSHPVPFLLLLAFCWGEVIIGWWNEREIGRAAGQEIARPATGDIATLVSANASLLYIAHYAHSGSLYQYEWLANWDLKLLRIVDVFRPWDVLPLRDPAYIWLLGGILCVVTTAVIVHARQKSGSGRITRMQFVTAFALLILLSLPLLPRTMNGSGFFADRFAIWPPFLLIATAAALDLKRMFKVVLGVVAAGVLAFSLTILHAHVAPIARQIDASSVPPGSLHGEKFVIESDSRLPAGISFDPFLLSAVRVVDRGGAFLLNSPWLELQIMMLEESGRTAFIDRQGNLRYPDGPVTGVGIVLAHCGASPLPPPELTAISADPRHWNVTRDSCFLVYRPR